MEGLLLPVLMFGALGLMMVFGMRKQKRQAAATQKMQNEVVPGARVMTTSGLHGTITAVADDTIELEIAPGVYTTWVRAAVREVVVPVLSEEDLDADADATADVTVDGDRADSQVVLDKDDPRQSDVG